MIAYYEELFKTSHPNNVDLSDVKEVIPNMVTDAQNLMLTAVPTPTDVKEAVFEMSAESAPSPDGYSGKFFKEVWSFIDDDLYAAIHHFFVSGELPMNFNSNFMVLIPNVE